MPLFAGKSNRNLLFFGLYSNGLPGPKRMIGTLGNPNYNAILFIFFLIWYAPKKNQSITHQLFYFIAFCLLIFCQSRTSLICFSLIYIANIFLSRVGYKKILLQTGIIISLFFIISNSGILVGKESNNKNLNYLNTDLDDLYDIRSLKIRIEMWEKALHYVKEKPVFGHSPDKQFFYETGTIKYIDGEYILMLFRYGIIGFLGYLALYIYPSIKALKNIRQSIQAKNMILLSIAFMTSALMNEPLTNNMTCYLYVIITALFFQFVYPPSKNIS